ncbi:hypothetical protein [Nocardia carnea]|uniref:hypothetical protein n=1 Tax=Nocardia carnea TaxID=37328 RepID=UPI0024588EA5|nr:hypothetical protein [Nocardia carnea]
MHKPNNPVHWREWDADALAEALKDVVPEVHIVGDAAKVDYIQGAIHTAWQAATKL